MKRYAAVCAVLALILVPGALPISATVLALRAIRRLRTKPKRKRIVLAYHGWHKDCRCFEECR